MTYEFIRKARVSSTNDQLSELSRAGNLTGDVILAADYQTDGKGQGSHGWESAPGENLLMSWFIRPAFLSASEQFMISKLVSLALIDHLDSYVGNVYIKWPNDILAGTRKIAGILIEHSIMKQNIGHSIIGVGLNINQSEFHAYPVPATSLFLETGRQYDVEKMTRKLVKALYTRYNQLKEGNRELLDRSYLEHLFRYRQRSLFASGGKHFEGVIRGINEFGQLLIERSGDLKVYNFNEVQLIFH